MQSCRISIQPLLLFNLIQQKQFLILIHFNTTLVTIQQTEPYTKPIQPRFQYNPCYYSTAICRLLCKSTVISIQPLLLFNCMKITIFTTLDNFNTTLVTIQLYRYKTTLLAVLFQYNPCYYSTHHQHLFYH